MHLLKSVIARSVLVAILVLGACMTVLLITANNRISENLSTSFRTNSLETTGFIANQINTGTRLKRSAMIEPQIGALLQDASIDAIAVRVTNIDGTEMIFNTADGYQLNQLPPLEAPDFSEETKIVSHDKELVVRTPVVLGAGENAILVGELIVVWDRSEYLSSVSSLTNFLRNAFLVTVTIVSAALMISIYLIIGKPLSTMVRVLTAVSNGTTDIELPKSNTTEVRRMVDTVEVFLNLTKERANLLEDLSVVMTRARRGDFSGRVQVEGDANDERNELRNLVNGLMKSVDGGIGETVRALEALSNRDLTQRMHGDFEGAFGKLSDDFRRTSSELNSTVLSIVRCAEDVQKVAVQLDAASDDSSRRAQSNTANLEETTAAITQVSEALSSTAKIANKAKSVSVDATMHAHKGKDTVNELVQKMNDIHRNSSSISDMVALIDDVAFQTNLLALNAGVEAASAGEHGRGFAVVASEVRALAQRTTESASNIKSLVAASSEDISNGMEQAAQAGKSIGEIAASIEQLENQISDISAKVSDQSSIVDEICTAVTVLDRNTQQSTNSINQTSILSNELRSESQSLMDIVSVFKVARDGTVVMDRSVA
jgi:methyl-accepting chemotaxis protein